jgi:dipeptidyl aminopeptidase/acylaminoacyl peptidase
MDSESPLWSPDGRQLLFLSRRAGDERSQLYLLPSDGGEARRLTRLKEGVVSAAWSPDGKRVAFLSPVDPAAGSRPTKGEGRPYASDVEVVGTAFWKLNGKGSLLRKRAHLFVVHSRGGRPVQLTDGDWSVGGAYLIPWAYTFSNDGQRIFYVATPDPSDDWVVARQADLHVVNLDGTGCKKNTEFPGAFLAVRQSPTGELIAIGNDMERSWASPNRLWRVDPETGGTEVVLPDLDLSIGDSMNCDVRFPTRSHDPWISPDGERVRFRVTHGPAVRLAEVHLAKRQLAWLTPPDQSVLGWHSTPGGDLRVEVRTTMTEMPELWAADQTGEVRRVTRLNARLLATRKVFAARHVPFTASDGARVDAWVHTPRRLRKGHRPLLLGIHGGPKTVYGHAFFLEFQILAGAGLAVAFSNPRGSDGYGTDWAHAVFGHYGERDYHDLMECVDHVLSMDLGLDPERLGVSGGSYGGFMTNWIIGHTDRFKAAVSQRGISDWVSFFGTSDIGFFFCPDQVGGLPWTDPDRYRDKSPLTYAEAMRTPLLIIHSEQDLRCPFGQAEELFVTLRRLDGDVRLARFPDETHELSRAGSPKRRMERLRLIVEWLREQLSA